MSEQVTADDPAVAPLASPASAPGPLRQKAARAAFTSGGGEIATRVAMVALSIVSARILEPREVGYLGAAVIVIGIISVISSYAETAAVTLPRSTDSSRAAITATALRAAAIGLLLGIAVIAVHWMGMRSSRLGALDVIGLVSILSWTLLFEILCTYPRTLLQRELDLDFLAVAQFLQLVAYVALGVWLLASGERARGLAIAQVIASGIAAAVVWLRLIGKRGLWSGWPSFAEWRETARRAGGLFVGLIGGFLCERIDNVMVAASIGTTAMSFYSMAWNASHMPANVFSRAINFVLVPTLPHLQDEPRRIERALDECLRYSYFVLVPVCAVLFVAAPDIVAVVLGQKWLPLVPCLKIMSISVLSAPLLFACTALLVGTGKAVLVSIATAIHFCLLVIVIPQAARRWGIEGAAFAELASVAILTTVVWTIARSATRLVSRSILWTPARFIAAGVCGGAVAFFARTAGSSDLLRLAISCVTTAAGYLVFVILFGERSVIANFGELLRSVTARRAVA